MHSQKACSRAWSLPAEGQDATGACLAVVVQMQAALTPLLLLRRCWRITVTMPYKADAGAGCVAQTLAKSQPHAAVVKHTMMESSTVKQRAGRVAARGCRLGRAGRPARRPQPRGSMRLAKPQAAQPQAGKPMRKCTAKGEAAQAAAALRRAACMRASVCASLPGAWRALGLA